MNRAIESLCWGDAYSIGKPSLSLFVVCLATKRTADGTPVTSFRSLLEHLATLTKNWLQVPGEGAAEFPMLSQPTPLQDQALTLLNITP